MATALPVSDYRNVPPVRNLHNDPEHNSKQHDAWVILNSHWSSNRKLYKAIYLTMIAGSEYKRKTEISARQLMASQFGSVAALPNCVLLTYMPNCATIAVIKTRRQLGNCLARRFPNGSSSLEGFFGEEISAYYHYALLRSLFGWRNGSPSDNTIKSTPKTIHRPLTVL